MQLITNVGQLTAEIRTMARTARELDSQLHVLGCSALNHAATKGAGDASLLTMWFQGLPKASRAKGAAVWLEGMGPLTVDRKTGVVRVKRGWKPEDFRIAAAIATPFWGHTSEREPGEMDLESFKRFIHRVAEGDFLNKEGKVTRKVTAEARDFAIAILRA